LLTEVPTLVLTNVPRTRRNTEKSTVPLRSMTKVSFFFAVKKKWQLWTFIYDDGWLLKWHLAWNAATILIYISSINFTAKTFIQLKNTRRVINIYLHDLFVTILLQYHHIVKESGNYVLFIIYIFVKRELIQQYAGTSQSPNSSLPFLVNPTTTRERGRAINKETERSSSFPLQFVDSMTVDGSEEVMYTRVCLKKLLRAPPTQRLHIS
jgi:hypothetical protein